MVGDCCRNVKRWQNENMAVRWAAAILLDAQKRFYRMRGHRELPILVEVLKGKFDIKEAVA
jgi:hypothetical protein